MMRTISGSNVTHSYYLSVSAEIDNGDGTYLVIGTVPIINRRKEESERRDIRSFFMRNLPASNSLPLLWPASKSGQSPHSVIFALA